MKSLGRVHASRLASALAAVLVVPFVACGQGALLRGQVDGLTQVADQARKNGAVKCAPRELALARAHIRFAQVELDQGELSNAKHHLAIAEPNARAALAVSIPERCGGPPAPEKPQPKPGDADGDGIPDAIDKCPEERENYNGFEDEDGCPDDPDTDGDKIPDSKDQCILEPEDFDHYLDEDGCPDFDNDADGIPDVKDKCPDKAEDPDGFQDDDGCPDPDNDGDTVPDVDDQCPNTAGLPTAERPGCPTKKTLVVITAKEIRITQQIQFDFNKATIKPESYRILDEVRDALRENPNIKLEIQGHTDNAGQAAYNLKLSQSRADSVRLYLVQHGIDAYRLVSRGYGMTQPLVKNDTEANRALNRRVQFIRTEASSAVP